MKRQRQTLSQIKRKRIILGRSRENESLQECDKERDSAYDVLNRDQAEYDKQILTLSATFLGVSVAFVKDIVPLNVAVSLWSYDVAICLLFLCVCFVLGTYQYSIHGHFWLINYWEKRKMLVVRDPGTVVVGQGRQCIPNECLVIT
jgi:hypothetical protein